jgi:hypothetical protein
MIWIALIIIALGAIYLYDKFLTKNNSNKKNPYR